MTAPNNPTPVGEIEAVGWLYFNEDAGTEFNEDHPIESGNCPDATDILPATAENLRDEMLSAWQQQAELREDIERLRSDHASLISQQAQEIAELRDAVQRWKQLHANAEAYAAGVQLDLNIRAEDAEKRVKELEQQIAFDTRPSHTEIAAERMKLKAAERERDHLRQERDIIALESAVMLGRSASALSDVMKQRDEWRTKFEATESELERIRVINVEHCKAVNTYTLLNSRQEDQITTLREQLATAQALAPQCGTESIIQVLKWRDEGMTLENIAETVGITKGAVWQAIRKSKRNLKGKGHE